MASFLDVTGMLVESELIVQCYPKVFKTVRYFHCLVVDGDSVLR